MSCIKRYSSASVLVSDPVCLTQIITTENTDLFSSSHQLAISKNHTCIETGRVKIKASSALFSPKS